MGGYRDIERANNAMALSLRAPRGYTGRMDLSHLALDPAPGRPRYRQLCDALAGAIARGDLPAGARLPAERELAAQLGISRTTAAGAYRELEARGLVHGQIGRGTFVCADPDAGDAPFAWRGKVAHGAERATDPALLALVRAVAPDTISFAPGLTALDCFPTALYGELTDALLRRHGAVAFGLGPTEGQPILRRALAARHGVHSAQLLVLAGSQQGLDLLARCLLDPGDAVLVDRPGYLGALQTFRAAGARLVGWDTLRADPEELEDLILRHRPKFLYTNPTFQNPTGGVLPLAARRALLDLAARYHLPIVEDDAYRELYFDTPPPPSLRELDEHGLVIGLGTLSKSLAPGLRLGWLIAPEAIVDQLALLKARTDVFNPGLTQLVLAELITRRHYDEHLHRLRAEHARRHAAMLAALGQHFPTGVLTARPVQGGLYLWCRLGAGLDGPTLARRAEAVGVTFAPGEPFYADGAGRREMRLCFTGVPPAQIAEGIRRLGTLFPVGGVPDPLRDPGRQPLVWPTGATPPQRHHARRGAAPTAHTKVW